MYIDGRLEKQTSSDLVVGGGVGEEGARKGKFQLFSLHYGYYRKGLASHLPGFRDSLAALSP